jgi:hypothetical protein
MASTYSDLKIELIGTGEQTGTWGTTTNDNFSIAVGEAITGSADVAFSSADVTLTLTNTNASQAARNLRLNLTGTSGGARNLILGSGCQIEKLYLINNGLADAVTVKNTSGTGIAVPAGKSMFVFNNGTNVVDAVTHLTSLTTGTLSASGATTFTAGTASTTTTTGTAVITGGLGVSGRINAANFDGIVGANTAAAGNFTTLGASGVATFSAGTVSAPAITTAGDTNTGIFFPAADTIAFTEGGVESMRIDSSGNVLVGTTSATSIMTIGNGAAANKVLTINGGTGSGLGAGMVLQRNSTQTAIFSTDSLIGGTADGASVWSSEATRFYTGGSNERMRIDSSGNVGIGTSSPAVPLDVVSNSSAEVLRLRGRAADNIGTVRFTSNNGVTTYGAIQGRSTYIEYATSQAIPLIFTTNSSERMRITSGGDVGIATSSPTSGLEIYRATSTTGSLTDASLMLSTTATTGRKVSIGFGLGGGVANTCAANIGYDVTNGAGAGLGDIYFSTRNTTADSTPTERMRINSDGIVYVGTTSQVGPAQFVVKATGNQSSFACWNAAGTSGFFNQISFTNNANNAIVGTIQRVNDNTIQYNTSSDYRLKENIVPMTGALAKVLALKPVNYKWKSDGTSSQGFIAHELQEVVPYAVSGEKDGELMQGVDYGKITPLLTAALQEALVKIELLEARLAVLESK